jgi:outer membrane protein TolC
MMNIGSAGGARWRVSSARREPIGRAGHRRASRSSIPLALSLLASLFARVPVTFAQPASPRPAAAPSAATAPAPAPPPILLDDEMLAPPPRAAKVLNNWREALQYILARSVDVATAEQEVLRAEGMQRVALAMALPSLTGNVNVTGQLIPVVTATVAPLNLPTTLGGVPITSLTTPLLNYVNGLSSLTPAPPNPSVLASLTASQPILAPRAWHGIKTAELGVTSNKLALEDKTRTIFAGVASSIISVFTAERTAEVNRSGLRSALERLNLTQRQLALGSGTPLDVLRTQSDEAAARATLVSGDEALLEAREALGLALGFREAYGVPPTISLDEIDQTIKNICAPIPLEERADIKKARNDIEIARRGITDAWLQFSPTATLSSTASVENGEQAITGKLGAWSISGVLTIPFWDGGARYGNLKIAKVQHEEAKLTFEAAIRSADINVQQALRSVAVAEKERAVSIRARDVAKEIARLTLRSFEVGSGTSFDVVTAAQTERAAELDLVAKDFALIQAKLSAVLALSNCAY